MHLSTNHGHTHARTLAQAMHSKDAPKSRSRNTENKSANYRSGSSIGKDKDNCGFVDFTQDLVVEHTFPHDKTSYL